MIDSGHIESNGLPWSMMDRSNFSPLIPVVVNTDISSGSGVHWIVMTILSDSTGYVYDPLGPRNQRMDGDGNPVDGLLRSRLLLSGARRVHFYPYASQMKTTTLCGWFSIYVAKMLTKLLRRHPDASEKDLDAVITSQFGKSADQSDVDLLSAAFTH